MKTYEQVVRQAALQNALGYFGGGDMYAGYRNYVDCATFIFDVDSDSFFDHVKTDFEAGLQHMNDIGGTSDDAIAWLEKD